MPELDFFLIVFRHNLALFVFLVVGALSLGLSSITLLGINGVSIGYDIGSIILTSPTDLKYLSVHLPLEMMMILLATCSSQQIGWTFFQDLILDQKNKVPVSAFVSLAIAALFLFLAAMAESGFRTLRIHGLL